MRERSSPDAGVRVKPLMTLPAINTDASKYGKSRQDRGYGRLWEIIRERVLQRDQYLCQNHRRQKIAKKATSVDHIIPKAHGGTDDDSNLESLCWECHRAKTAREHIR